MNLSLEVAAERIRQSIEVHALQGDIVDGLREDWERSRTDYPALMAIHDRLKTLPKRPGWAYEEPSTLDAIRCARPDPVPLPDFYLSEAEIRQKILGAWLGRVSGCILGKPLEMGFSADDIRTYLEGADGYPLSDYVPSQSRNGRPLRRDCVPSMRGYVQYAQEDDDLNYMCLAVKLLERKGPSFTTLDVGMNWLESIPFLWTWGPEHVVYLNMATAVGEHAGHGIDLEAVTSYLNPGVEWIGAQIRTDVYGYVCPGRPALAAEFAWRDAYLTHRQNGIYGPMWVSAMNAAAFTRLNMESIIQSGLDQIPRRSRFAEAISRVIDWWKTDRDWRQTGTHICEQYDQYGFGGAINNACCVAAALLYGWGDGTDSPAAIFERTITTAVQLGYDTDCNGATAGSAVGLVLGAAMLPDKWTAPLHDTLRTCVAEFGQVSIREMAGRCYELSRIVRTCGVASDTKSG
ncbi:MAG TPA: ADP-ribosylglycohydrolase family protein [Aggregatilineales bacterium]|nr:ADP-ribosylglycohydrolase family protein [Aggregatilineales bacterium]